MFNFLWLNRRVKSGYQVLNRQMSHSHLPFRPFDVSGRLDRRLGFSGEIGLSPQEALRLPSASMLSGPAPKMASEVFSHLLAPILSTKSWTWSSVVARAAASDPHRCRQDRHDGLGVRRDDRHEDRDASPLGFAYHRKRSPGFAKWKVLGIRENKRVLHKIQVDERLWAEGMSRFQVAFSMRRGGA